MMKLLRTSLLAALITVLISCGGQTIIEESYEVPGASWHRDDEILFHAVVDDQESDFDVELRLAYTDAFSYDELVVVFRMVAPSGNVRSREYRISMRDQDGKPAGTLAGDHWEMSETLLRGIRFDEKGEYTFEIDNVMPRVEVGGLTGIGILVRESKNRESE